MSLSNSAILEKDGHYYYDQRNDRRLRDGDRMSVRSGTHKKQNQVRQGNLEKWSKSYVQNSKNVHPKMSQSGTVKKIQEIEEADILPTEFKLRRKQESQPTLERGSPEKRGDTRAHKSRRAKLGKSGRRMEEREEWEERAEREALALAFKKKEKPRVEEEPEHPKRGGRELSEMIKNITEHSRSSAEDESELQNGPPKRGIFHETMNGEEACPSEKETTKINNGSGGPSYNELSQLVESLREENSQLKATQEDLTREAGEERLAHERTRNELNQAHAQVQNLGRTLAQLEKEAGLAGKLQKKLGELEDGLNREKSRNHQKRQKAPTGKRRHSKCSSRKETRDWRKQKRNWGKCRRT